MQLKPIKLADLDASQAYILALAPNLALDKVLAARAKISAPKLRITELNPAWLERLGKLALQ